MPDREALQEARMNEPSPIRGRWTVTLDSEGRPRHVGECAHVAGRNGWSAVEVVPVPDEQAIDRAVDELMYDSGPPRFGPHRVAVDRRFRLGLAAALEQPDAGP